MPLVPIPVPTLIGGVSRVAQSLRDPNQVEEATNVTISLARGIEKRPGTTLVGTDSIAVTNPTNTKHIGWIDRDADERFFYLIDPAVTRLDVTEDLTVGPSAGDTLTQAVSGATLFVTAADIVNDLIFGITTGTFDTTNTVTSDDAAGVAMAPATINLDTVASGTQAGDVVEVFDINGVAQTVPTPNAAILSYIGFSNEATTYDPRRRIRSLPVADATFICARTKPTAIRGGGLTYRNAAGTSDVRSEADEHNVVSWANFDHPPTVIDVPGSIPDLPAANTNFDSGSMWFAREDDVGQQQGWYMAISTTQPPWFSRVVTEGTNSRIDEATFPVRMDFDGTSTFTLSQTSWTDRFSGDSATNPGPSFIGSGISDIAFHQNRFWFASGEILASSQAADLFNLWIQSEILTVDSDPIDSPLTNNRVSNIDFITEFREALILTTSGSRQFEMRADGPLGPNTSILQQTTAIKNVNYVQPVTLADQMYFVGERNFANTIWEYFFDPTSSNNTAFEITSNVEGYIPAEMSLMEPSEAHDVLFAITDAVENEIYIYRTKFIGEDRVLFSFYKWVTDTGNEILSMRVFDEELFLVIRRNNLIFLERIAADAPEDDTIGTVPNIESMGYAVRLDRKMSLTGTFDSDDNTTTWTFPFEDTSITEIVLGPGWDVDVGANEQRLAGTRLFPTVTAASGTTTLVVDGQFATNLNGDPEIAYAGRPFVKLIRLSEQFVRGEGQIPVFGTVKLLSGVIRHKDTGFYTVEITAENRTTLIREFVFQRTGSTFLDGVFVEPSGEFQFRVMGEADTTTIEIRNDSPLPSNIVDLEFKARFVPSKKDPTK